MAARRARVVVRGLAAALALLITAVTASAAGFDAQLSSLIAEAVANNPELAAARSERDAARQRVASSGALENPMLELGLVNAPIDSWSLRREDMTMRMLGLSQKLPFPGKRGLRRAVATADAESLDLAAQESANKVVRDVRVAYEELALNEQSRRILDRTRTALSELEAIARSRYNVGQAAQSDVLDVQVELERLRIRQLGLTRGNATLQSELRRSLGRNAETLPVTIAEAQKLVSYSAEAEASTLAIEARPQLQALQALIVRSGRSLELARREYFPDFDLRLQYGRRARAIDGTPRDDMLSVTVGVSLPIWRRSLLNPQIAEARAMSNRAQNVLTAQSLETQAALDTQLAVARESRQSAALLDDTLLPQARASTASAFAAYRVGRVDFLTLRQAQLREYELSAELAEAIAEHNKAIAEIDLLVGRQWPYRN